MNWVRNHVSVREEKIRSKQREFFAQKRLEKQARTQQASSGMSLDLLAVKRMNRDSPKKDGHQHQRVIKVDLDKFARFQKKVPNIDLGPMSPAKHVSSDGSDDRVLSFKGNKHSGQLLSNARLTPMIGVKGLGQPSSGSSRVDFIPPLLPQPKSQHATQKSSATPLIENSKPGQRVTFDSEAKMWELSHSISPVTVSSKQKSGDTGNCLLKHHPLRDLSPSRMFRGGAHENLFMTEDFQDCFHQPQMDASRKRNDRATYEQSKDETEIFKGFMDHLSGSKKRNWVDEDGKYHITSKFKPVSEDGLTLRRRQDFDEEERKFRVASKYTRGTFDDLVGEKIKKSNDIRLLQNDWKLNSLESLPSGAQSGWKTSKETSHGSDLAMPRIAGANGNKWLDHCNDSVKYFKDRSSSVERPLTRTSTGHGFERTVDKAEAADFLKIKKFDIISPKENFDSQGRSVRSETGRSSSTSMSSDAKNDEHLHYGRRQFHREAVRVFQPLQNSLSPDVGSRSWSAGSSDDERASSVRSSSQVSSKCSNHPLEVSSLDRYCGQFQNIKSKYFTDEDNTKSSSNNWLKFAKGEIHGPVVPACQNSQVPVPQSIDKDGVFHTEITQVGSQSSSESVVNSRTMIFLEGETSEVGIISQRGTMSSSSNVQNDTNQLPGSQKSSLRNQMAEEFVAKSFSSSDDRKIREFESTAEVELSNNEVKVEHSDAKVDSQANDECSKISESRKSATKYKPFRELEICETSSVATECTPKISFSTPYVQSCRSTAAETTVNGSLPLLSDTSFHLPRTLALDGFTQTSPGHVLKVVDTGTSPVQEIRIDGLLSPMHECLHLKMCDICRSKSATVDAELSPVFRRDLCDAMLSPVFQRSVADAELSPVVFNRTVEAQLSPIHFDFRDTLMNEVNQKTEIMNLPQEMSQNTLMLLSSDGKATEVPEVLPDLQLFHSGRSMEEVKLSDLRQLSESPSVTLQVSSESTMCLDEGQPKSTSGYTVEEPVACHPDTSDDVVKVDHGSQQDLVPAADEQRSVDYNEAPKNLVSAELLTKFNDEILENGTLSHHVLVSSDTKPCCTNIDFHAGFYEPENAATVVSTIEGMETGENLILKPENHESLGSSSSSSVYSSPIQ